MNSSDLGAILQRVREENPLVHNITNVVVTNFTANGLLSLGASPVMAYAKEEVADMVRISRALVLGVEKNLLLAGLSALTFYGIAAEKSFEKVGNTGPGSFQIEFLNQLALVSSEDIHQLALFKQV